MKKPIIDTKMIFRYFFCMLFKCTSNDEMEKSNATFFITLEHLVEISEYSIYRKAFTTIVWK